MKTQGIKTGVWIDLTKAVMVSLDKGNQSVEVIESGIAGRERFEGETSQEGRFGGQFLDDERKKQLRRKMEIDDYLEAVKEHLEGSDAIAVFGPADMKVKLARSLQEDSRMHDRLEDVVSADSMTDNQVAAMVRDHFGE